MAEPSGGYAVAQGLVTSKMSAFNDLMNRYGASLTVSLDKIAKIQVREVAAPNRLNAPDAPAVKFDKTAMPKYSASSFSVGSAPILGKVHELLSDLDIHADLDIPAPPAAPSVNIGSAPNLSYVAKPSRPDVDTNIRLPDAPNVVIPDLDGLTEIVLPEFHFPELPDFNGTPPSPDGIAVPDVFINWQEPKYKSEVLDNLVIQVADMMRGGTGIPPVIEDALFARARERESAETERLISETVQTWASRGFSLPQGALDKQISVLREQGRLKAAELNRDIMVQAATWEIENLRFAVQQGIAIEGLIQNVYENMTNRLFEVAKFDAEAQINVFNARISLFNAQNQAFATLADVYRTKLDGVQAKLAAYKTALEGQAVIGDLNKQKVDIYRAKLEAVNMNIERYKTMMSAASIQADIIAKEFDMYRADIQAYTEELNAEKLKLEAYQTSIQGEKAKVEVFQAQTQAFATTIQAVSNKADIFVKQANLKMDAAKLGIQEYQAKMDGYRAQLQADLNKVQFETQAFQAQVDAWKAGASVATAEAEMNAKYADMARQTNIAYSQMQIEQYRANSQNAISEAQIALEAAKAQGSYYAQLAAGAMSAQHVSASVSSSASESISQSKSTSTSHNYSY